MNKAWRNPKLWDPSPQQHEKDYKFYREDPIGYAKYIKEVIKLQEKK